MAGNQAPDSLPEFEKIDFGSTEGMKLKRTLESRLEGLRRQNDSEHLSERETAAIRGHIAEIKALLRPAAPVVPLARYDNQQLQRR